MRRDLIFSRARWIDLQAPTLEEAHAVGALLALPPELTEELATPTVRSRFEVYPQLDTVYLAFSIPTVKRPGNDTEAEVDLVISPHWLVTVHYEHVDPLHKLWKELEVAALAKEGVELNGIGLAKMVLLKLYSSVRHELSAVRSDLEAIERKMYDGEEKAMVFAIAQSARDLLNIRQAIEPHAILWKHWEENIARTFTTPEAQDEARHTLRRVRRAFEEALLELRALADWLRELRETNNSLVSTKQNEVMKILTVMAFVTFPLTLISSIFGMNTRDLPIVGTPGDFWIVIGIMAVLTVVFLAFFWYKGWLK